MIDTLRRIPLFAELSEADLTWLSTRAEPVVVEAGQHLIEEGQAGDAAYVVLDGEFDVVKRSSHQDIVIAVRNDGEVFGEMALIDQTPRSATVRAKSQSHVLKIRGEAFQELLAHSPSASMSILRTVSRRLRQNDALVRQNEKMAALGTLAAGLAHELNNPAAAIRRSAEHLRSALNDWTSASSGLQHLSLGAGQLQRLDELKAGILAAQPVSGLDALTQSDRESELQTWLEKRALAEPWQLAPTLVSAGWDAAKLSGLEQDFPGPTLGPVIQWLVSGLAVHALLDEVALGAERVSAIVKDVKAYAYLDQAPIQQVDIPESLENTLAILRPKFDGIKIVRDYAADLPRVEAYGGELNQVWTNILDNAAYAMHGAGTLQLRASHENGEVRVEIQDSGPGIPSEIQQRIFEPFFTTKPPGQGTGLGLHIVYSIINNHYGRIRLTSQPGSTCFQIALPVELPR
ncbi:MAG TPA: ATP-binding protein [Anaerolineales bacterium]